MEPYILLIGAFERDNFGDLLFSKIFDKILDPHKTIKGSLIGRDLTSIGGDCVVSIRDYLTSHINNPPLAVIHCGGQTIGCLKETAIDMDLPSYIFEQEQNKKMYQYYTSEIAGKLSSTDNSLAYLYSHVDLMQKDQKVPIAFTSIGNSSLNRFAKDHKLLSEIKSKLKSAKFISVRDRKTQKYLKEYLGIEAKVHPDVVSIISRTHVDQVSEAMKDPKINKIINDRPYILFQASQDIIKSLGINLLAKKLSEITRNTKMSLILQPAGLAIRHDSLDSLREIAKLVSKNDSKVSVIIQEDRNLWNQVAIIANASCCIGTSLHVRIVATSFARPCVSLASEKITSYVESWEFDTQPYNVYLNELPQAVERAMKTDPNKLRQNSNYLADKVEEGLGEMLTALNLNSHPKFKRKKDDQLIPLDLFSAISAETDRLRELLVKEIIDKHSAEHKLNLIEQELNLIRSSRSWKITIPLRSMSKKFKKLKKNTLKRKQ